MLVKRMDIITQIAVDIMPRLKEVESLSFIKGH